MFETATLVGVRLFDADMSSLIAMIRQGRDLDRIRESAWGVAPRSARRGERQGETGSGVGAGPPAGSFRLSGFSRAGAVRARSRARAASFFS